MVRVCAQRTLFSKKGCVSCKRLLSEAGEPFRLGRDAFLSHSRPGEHKGEPWLPRQKQREALTGLMNRPQFLHLLRCEVEQK